jgi:hypothetical protein
VILQIGGVPEGRGGAHARDAGMLLEGTAPYHSPPRHTQAGGRGPTWGTKTSLRWTLEAPEETKGKHNPPEHQHNLS